MRRLVAIAACLSGAPCAPAQDAPAPEAPASEALAPDRSQPLVDHPHPLITEIFFSVPGSGGDANADGRRSPAGDEFVELMNPHDRPINLIGYELSDRPTASQFRFRFPDLVLAPGAVVVVFNGHDSEWRGPVGDELRAPEAPHTLFEGAWVLTARAESEFESFSNSAEFVLLTSPAGLPVHAVEWGEPDDTPPPETQLLERVTPPRGRSLQRGAPGGPLLEHPETMDTPEGVMMFDLPCSPGVALPGWTGRGADEDDPAVRPKDDALPDR